MALRGLSLGSTRSSPKIGFGSLERQKGIMTLNNVIDNFIRSLNGRAAVTSYYRDGIWYFQIQSDIGTFDAKGSDKDKTVDKVMENFHIADIRRENQHVQNAS